VLELVLTVTSREIGEQAIQIPDLNNLLCQVEGGKDGPHRHVDENDDRM